MADLRQRCLLALALTVAAPAWAGCGGPGDGGGAGGGGASGGGEASGGGPSRMEPAALCAQVVRLQCEGHIRCCDREADKYASLEECASLLEPLCAQDLAGAAYARGVIAFDAAAFERAIERLRAAAGACDPVGREIWLDVFRGTLADGEDCTPAVEQSDYSSLLACGPGLACVVKEGSGDSAERLCRPRAGRDQACQDVECADGLFCESSGRSASCRPLRAATIGCTAHAECETGFCGENERCGARTVSYRYCDDLTYP